MRLKARRILITGAASGIGRATAELFAAEGAQVGLLDRNKAPLQELGARLQAATAVADVADDAEVDSAVQSLGLAMGGIDGVVNAAGMDLMQPFGAMTTAEWRRVMAINLDGPMRVCRAALPQLKAAGGGTIVNIGSGAGLRPLEHRTAYCASKAGLIMFTKTLAVDLAADNVRANAICPGIIDTPMFRGSFENAPDPQAELAKILDRYVIKRIGRPEEIALAALYLSSRESAYVTGAALAVDGGRTFH